MCFSAEASFVAGGVLVPAGAYCVMRAAQYSARCLPLALVPLAFSAQQFSEGVVWLGLNRGDEELTRLASQVFLFFAIAFWPFMVPFSLCIPEPRRRQRAILALISVLSLVWLWVYAPLALEPARWLSTEIVHHSIGYQIDDLPAFSYAPQAMWRVVYLLFICIPLAVALPKRKERGILLPVVGVLVIALFLVSYVVFWYAFTSVWCFFAAFLSLVLCVVFYQLPRSTDAVARGEMVAHGAGRSPGSADNHGLHVSAG
jgi:hypothetical protein